MAKLRINPLVADDLLEIKKSIAEDNPEAALNTVREIYSRFEGLLQFPSMGANLSNRVSFKTDLKYLIWENYIILYWFKMKEDYVEIYRVLNRFQDITRVFEK